MKTGTWMLWVLLWSVLAGCAHDPLRERAERGDAQAQVALAAQSRQPEQAFAWYQKAALQGHASGQNSLAVMYLRGEGVSQDYQRAYHWFAKSAEQGNATAAYNLGNLYQRGLGTAQDYRQAMDWYRKASDGGIVAAQMQLAEMFEQGQGVAPDFKQAYAWAALAASSGDVQAEKARNKMKSLLNLEDLLYAQQLAQEFRARIK